MNLLFLADIHIKYPKKVPKDWQYNRFMMLAEEINKVDCNLLIIGGDTLDSAKPTTAEMALFFDFLSKIKHRTLVFSGNHEMLTKSHSILWDLKDEITRCNPNIEVITSESYSINTFDIIDYMDINKPFKVTADIAFTHVRGAIEPHVKPEIDLTKFSQYKRVYAGDLHSYENSQLNIFYPGSPLTTSFHRTRATKSNGMFLINENSHEWIDLSHLPQLIKKTITTQEEMVPTAYDFTIYELEGNIAELAAVSNSELLDKKVNNVVTKESKLDLKSKTIEEQMHTYLETIQHLPPSTIERLLRRFATYAAKKTTI